MSEQNLLDPLSDEREQNDVFHLDGKRTWLTPKRMLVMFTMCSFITYIDRGAFAVVLDDIEEHLEVSDLQKGILLGAYMFGFTFASPTFAHIANFHRPFRTMGFGLLVWCAAMFGCGFAPEFWTLLLSRTLTGIGEASFLCLAPPFIDTYAPADRRSAWLSVFFSVIPLGYAGGFSFAAVWSTLAIKETLRWRTMLMAQGLMMLPFVAMALLVKGPETMLQVFAAKNVVSNVNSEDTTPHKKPTLRENINALTSNKVYLCTVAGYAAQTFVVGGFAGFGPTYIVKVFGWSMFQAGVAFGGVAAVTGLFGTAAGGIALDKLVKRAQKQASTDDDYGTIVVDPESSSQEGETPASLAVQEEEEPSQSGDVSVHGIRSALRLILCLSIGALPLGAVAFWVGAALFFVLLVFAEGMLFAQLAPINSVVMWSVPPRFRAFALACSVVMIHCFGDAISPMLVGAIADATDNWRLAMFLLASWLLVSVSAFAAGLWFASTKAWERLFLRGDSQQENDDVNESVDARLLPSRSPEQRRQSIVSAAY
ncbi:MAG: hypothetical protein MHM6MM_003440 [Cercozoa sp. M6MM]